MKLLKWLDQMFDRIGSKIANYYLRNFCHYK